jgi:hypothetical protein
LEKVDRRRGVFYGEVVVKCVANVVEKQRFAEGPEVGQVFEDFSENFFNPCE